MIMFIKKSIIPRSLVAKSNVIDCDNNKNDEILLGFYLSICQLFVC